MKAGDTARAMSILDEAEKADAPGKEILHPVAVVIFGGLTVWLNDERFIKMKPTFIYLLLAGMLGLGLVLTLLVQIPVMVAYVVATHALAPAIGIDDLIAASTIVMFAASVPISFAGWGVRESALVMAFSYAGLPAADGLVVSVLLGAVMFATGLIGGGVWLMSFDSSEMAMALRSPAPPAEP